MRDCAVPNYALQLEGLRAVTLSFFAVRFPVNSKTAGLDKKKKENEEEKKNKKTN